jgi:uncharacterized membrane protein YeaQ/YmgE (transglycosylase-associated protein family)
MAGKRSYGAAVAARSRQLSYHPTAKAGISFKTAILSVRGCAMGEFLLELWAFMKERKKFWLLPIILCIVLLGSLIVFTSGSAVAPFIYTLF